MNVDEIVDIISDEIYDEYGVEKEEESRAYVIEEQLRCSDFEQAIRKAVYLARQGYIKRKAVK